MSICQIAYFKTLCTQNTCIDAASLKLFVPPTQTHNICPEHATIINFQTTKLVMSEDETLKSLEIPV